MRLNRPEAAERRHWAGPVAIGLIILAWTVQFSLFSLERFLREPAAISLATIGARAIVSLFGALISLTMLKILQRCGGVPFVKRAMIALGLALGAAGLHSIINTVVFLAILGPNDPGNLISLESFAGLVYLFGWTYLAITIILLSLTYGEELLHRERRIAELTAEADALKRLRPNKSDGPFFWVRKGHQTIRLDAPSIDWIAAEGECVRFHCGPESYLERQSISAVDQQLAPFGFVRIHRSAVVNADRIESLSRTRWGSLQVRLAGGTDHRVSRTYQAAVREILGRP